MQRRSHFGRPKLTLAQAQASFRLHAPPDADESKWPEFMRETPRAPRQAPNQHHEKDFVNTLLKLASDFYSTGIKKIWLKKNAQGVARTYDGKRVIKYGLGVGTGDAIGYVSRLIKPEDVGKKIAVFVSVEAKAAGGRASEEQKAFVEQVNGDGGMAMIAFDVDGVHAVINRLCP